MIAHLTIARPFARLTWFNRWFCVGLKENLKRSLQIVTYQCNFLNIGSANMLKMHLVVLIFLVSM